ncbi:TIGR01244 family sulfur transferase [Sphingosinicella humi]|uniref:TIGR01244 family phosphatase n=1 Tax=Allosphingosinicella humi TaxID=2068657 RepID=A0A2U2J3W0_9SPHN|nr:TIGR01244 family sulfur transferase [Sphingosinicella humi]PWG03039.1 TIGR01244 family phosphatase [Sphingosinicella humi]
MDLTRLSDQLATGPQVRPEQLREIAASGFVGVINNRPDGEAPDQPSSLELEAEAKRVGLAYWHVPVVPGAMTDSDIRAFAAALGEADGPVLAFCRTGNRSTALWKASQAVS